ncbi:MAG TPA: hypothetical protein VFB63_00875 [Bryobacteraceae bacterium]|nr:hypothetical protein [Bryobacteraceae bacterium]
MPTVYARTVRRAAQILHGRHNLAKQLHVPEQFVADCIAGTVATPQDLFLQCVDIVVAYEVHEISGSHSSPKGAD